LEETKEIAKEWLEKSAAQNFSVDDADRSQATVVGLSGHLGAGKTAFVKAVAKLLGVKEEVTSPTFVIMKIYEVDSTIELSNDLTIEQRNNLNIQNVPWKRLIHIDAYRLEKPEEMEVLNFDQLVADPHNLIMVEWPENVELEKVIPDYQKIRFEVVSQEYRIG
jgi:tRNA A37 threonylcarbamoyladenosine biosynthesis protein TsaE